MSIFCIFLGPLGFTSDVFAQTNTVVSQDFSELDRFITSGMEQTDMPGIAVSIIEDGDVLFSKGYGIASNDGRPVTDKTQFQIGSGSKSFTALAILQLVDEGRLELDRPIRDYIPDFRPSDQQRSSEITTRHLLTHRSGLSAIDGNRYQYERYAESDTLAIAIDRFNSARLRTDPGQKFEYSNANYAILGHLLEVIDNASFEDIIDSRIFQPLGMTRSYVQRHPIDQSLEASGYRHFFGMNLETRFTSSRMMAPANGVVSTVEDLGKYLTALSKAETDMLSPYSRDAMFAGLPAFKNTDYGFGWGIERHSEKAFVSHEGLNSGFKSVIGFYPETGQTYVVLSNRSSGVSDSFVLSILDVALHRSPLDFEYKRSSYLTVLGLCFVSVVLLGGLYFNVYVWKKGLRQKQNARRSGWKRVKVFVGAFVLFAVSYLTWVLLPSINDITLRSIYPFYPDLAVGLGATGAIALIWGSFLLVTFLYGLKKQITQEKMG